MKLPSIARFCDLCQQNAMLIDIPSREAEELPYGERLGSTNWWTNLLVHDARLDVKACRILSLAKENKQKIRKPYTAD
jgi:hypothetical protein